ncbi:MAG TPA: hypothetical protein VEH57_01920 [Thermoplasmata archaeon]|nr:hypothetical protein [Thermoplasmata archaeon]
MSAPAPVDLAARVRQLETELDELRVRVVLLERLVGNVGEHTLDRSIVREKARYDWQAPDRE